MLHKLENRNIEAVIDTHAAEIASLKRKDKTIEYLWNGDPQYWKNRDPILFPHVSAPSNKILNFKGKDCRVGNHGFARRSEFTPVEQDDDHLVLELKDNEETLKEYPYHFTLRVNYQLQDEGLRIDYAVSSDEDIVFGFGLHPAFRCPLVPEKSFADYHVEFDQEDVEGKRLDLSYELFEKYPTYVINEPKSRIITLSDGTNKVIMKIDEGYGIFALWTPHAPFVCLEPWVNTIEENDLTTPFEQRKGNIHLKANEVFRIGYGLQIV